MGKKLIYFSVPTGIIALLFQTKVFTALTGNRLAACAGIGILLAAFCACWMIMDKTRAFSKVSLPVSILIQISFGGALICPALCFLTTLYFGNESLDGMLVYIRQMAPLILFFGFNCLLLCLSGLFQIRTNSRCGTGMAVRRILSIGRIVWQAELIFGACLILFVPYIPIRANYYPSHDYSIFSYIGQQILKGRIPYTELWDHKPPVIFYINALALFLTNGNLIGIWLFELVALFIGQTLFFKVLCRRFPEWLSLTVTMLGILHFARLFDFGNYTEEFSLFFQLCALSLWFGGDRKKRLLRALISGLLCGLAFTCKQNTIGCWAAIFLIEFFQTLFETTEFPIKNQLKRGGLFFAGFLIVNIAWAVYFASKGALMAYWEVAFQYNFLYAEQSGESRIATGLTTLTFLPGISPFLCIGFLSWIGVIFVQVRGALGKRMLLSKNRLLLWAVIALAVELVFAGLSGMNYQHYFILCIPPVCVLVCWFGERSFAILRIRVSDCAAKLFVVVFLTICSLPLLNTYRASYEPRTPSAYTKTAAFLEENTTEEDFILVWGSRSAIYVMTERNAPTAYFNERPLYLFGDYVEAGKWDEFLDDLKRNPPKYIIDTDESHLPFIGDRDGTCVIPEAPDYRIPTYVYLCGHYALQEVINEGMNDEWFIYRNMQ